MKVYVVTSGEYSDYHIVAAFSSEDRARQYVEKAKKLKMYDWDTLEIEDYELDLELYNTNYLWISYTPDQNKVEYSMHEGVFSSKPALRTYGGVPKFDFTLPARIEYADEALLLKIAQDKYAQYKAEQEIF